MKNGFTFFLGLFLALALAWTGIVLGSHVQLGHLAPYFDETEGKAYPERLPGIAVRGQLVYQDLGCAACHTQQVRRPDFGSDKARGWGDRQSVARDYVSQPSVQLGESRIGPDLANFGARPLAVDADRLTHYLYEPHGSMPPYRFLFEQRKITGERSSQALNVPAPEGFEVVPTHRAAALVAYLQSLNNAYEYPEARPVEPVTAGEPVAPTKPAAPVVPGAPASPAKPAVASPVVPAAPVAEKKEGEHK
jgi:cytochrome c oxidase cbb3-type subunit 2